MTDWLVDKYSIEQDDEPVPSGVKVPDEPVLGEGGVHTPTGYCSNTVKENEKSTTTQKESIYQFQKYTFKRSLQYLWCA